MRIQLIGSTLASLSFAFGGLAQAGSGPDVRQTIESAPIAAAAAYVVNGTSGINGTGEKQPDPEFTLQLSTQSEFGQPENRQYYTVSLLLNTQDCYSQQIGPENFLLSYGPGAGGALSNPKTPFPGPEAKITPMSPSRFLFSETKTSQLCVGEAPVMVKLNAQTIASRWDELERVENKDSTCKAGVDCLIRSVKTRRVGQVEVMPNDVNSAPRIGTLEYLETFTLVKKADGSYDARTAVSQPKFSVK